VRPFVAWFESCQPVRNSVGVFEFDGKKKAPDRLITQVIGGKLNRDTHPGT
jgi:hypothetical protein